VILTGSTPQGALQFIPLGTAVSATRVSGGG
jgi:hypothetical protein